jgi:hypothetical protein
LGATFVGSPAYRWQEDSLWARVEGRLCLAHDDVITDRNAHCRLMISPQWRTVPPSAFCLEPWAKSHMDWHAGSGGWLCYVLDNEWRDHIAAVEQNEGNKAAMIYAVQYCIRNLRWLLYRHFMASVIGISEWPKDWPQWSHAEAGRREYEQTKRTGGYREAA